MSESLRVNAESYASSYSVPDQGRLLRLHRRHQQGGFVDIDAFGRTWSMARAELTPGQVSIRRGNRLVALSGAMIAFIPPFSLVEWHIGAPVEFDAILCDQRLPDFVPTEPLCFLNQRGELPSRLEDILAFLNAGHKAIPIGRPLRPAAIARKIKEVIDRSYADHRTLGSIASQLGIRPQFMTAVFKRDYGLSPSLYRARLRIWDSIPLLLEGGMSVTDVAFEVGFGDLSRYQKQFRRQTQVPPSSFRLRRGTPRDVDCWSTANRA